MTLNSPLTRGPFQPAAPAVQLLTRQSVIPLPQTVFFRSWRLLCEAQESLLFFLAGPPSRNPPLLSARCPTYLTQKGIEIPTNAT
jgi:hypothetical protein